ncbi:MAG: pirin family protein [Flavobacteriaceae bacterium]|nr:pirin family protein [Flavobacteriaceae bacterium]
MKKIFHGASTRGEANHGWLQAKHSFSFANYFNPERIQFGALRVLNDDTVAPGMGFGSHPHDNMEIITIPLKGALEHKDSMDNVGVIEADEIQVMSAGTGVYHSEYNRNKDQAVSLLQIWIFPNEQNVKPRYDQKNIKDLKKVNALYPVVTPDPDAPGMWIHQDAWFHMGDFNTTTELEYDLHKKGNGVYAFLIEGTAEIAGETLQKRDALGVWDTDGFSLKANPHTRILLIEVPKKD